MILLFDTPNNPSFLIGLAIAYGIIASITTFDIRIYQAKKSGLLPADEPSLPRWVGILHWLEWLVFISMLLLNWKFALLVYVAKFILKVLPVLETIGNILMAPFKPRRNSVNNFE